MSTMDEATFQRELAKYKVVRSRDCVAYPTRPHSRKVRPAILAPVEIPVKPAGVTLDLPASSSPAEFWDGLDSFMKKYIPSENNRARVLRAFDEVHYSRIRALNLEDIDDLATCFVKELDVHHA